ncbi:hypothetical protein Ahy_A07g034059 [Arachis hypogaea]|uniref:ATP phosphoribosyltransferase n=1 Tax=Arachis hypogaea TaxID=3818 RepID=A0A445CAV0_ARAHY|nr:hypothetical protein Ahy_A07g034059 [Arachis hypogaea]
MGIADAFLDLVSSGTTLRENNLKEIEGVLEMTHEILERLEAHLRAIGQFSVHIIHCVSHCSKSNVTANMKGSSAEEVAKKVLSQPSLYGFQGRTISLVFWKRDRKVKADYYAIVISVPKKALYKSIQQLRAIGGSGVLISPLTYIFYEEMPRWCQLPSELGL